MEPGFGSAFALPPVTFIWGFPQSQGSMHSSLEGMGLDGWHGLEG